MKYIMNDDTHATADLPIPRILSYVVYMIALCSSLKTKSSPQPRNAVLTFSQL